MTNHPLLLTPTDSLIDYHPSVHLQPVFAMEQGVPNRFTGKIPAPKEVVKEANGGTLVIVPVSLLLQWKKEIETKTKGLSM